MNAQWLWRWIKIVALGVVFAVVVTEIELAAGFDLLDAPFFHVPWQAAVLGVVALAFALWQARPSTTMAGLAAGVLVFGIVVLPLNALTERPAMPVDFWRGNAGLLLDRSMTINRPHSVVLIIKAASQVSRTMGAIQPTVRDVLGADLIVARLYAEPRPAFTILPDKEQPKPISLTEDLRWAWTATPWQQGPQRLVLELDTLVKNRGAADTVSNLYRQFVLITVQPPSWYEVARQWLIEQVFGA
jgi:hypothetical protein